MPRAAEKQFEGRRNGSPGRRTGSGGGPSGRWMSRKGNTFRFFLTLAVLLSLSVLILLRMRLGVPWLFAWLGGVNLSTFLAYLYDKSAAGRDWRRVPEDLLHILAAAGGSPAAVIAQSAFHHKTVKGSFRRWFWAIFVTQLVLAALWLYLERPWR